jgi:hypothetical protein
VDTPGRPSSIQMLVDRRSGTVTTRSREAQPPRSSAADGARIRNARRRRQQYRQLHPFGGRRVPPGCRPRTCGLTTSTARSARAARTRSGTSRLRRTAPVMELATRADDPHRQLESVGAKPLAPTSPVRLPVVMLRHPAGLDQPKAAQDDPFSGCAAFAVWPGNTVQNACASTVEGPSRGPSCGLTEPMRSPWSGRVLADRGGTRVVESPIPISG